MLASWKIFTTGFQQRCLSHSVRNRRKIRKDVGGVQRNHFYCLKLLSDLNSQLRLLNIFLPWVK